MNISAVMILCFVQAVVSYSTFQRLSSFMRLTTTRAHEGSNDNSENGPALFESCGEKKNEASTTESVHLQLTKMYDLDDSNLSNSTCDNDIDLIEYIDERTNSTILACVGDIPFTHFEHFAMHMVNLNLSTHPGVRTSKVISIMSSHYIPQFTPS